MKLSLDQLDLLACTLRVEQSLAHVDRDTIHVLDLHQHLVSRLAKRRVAALVGAGSMVPSREILEGQTPSELNRLVDGSARNRSVVGNPLTRRGIAEEQTADVLDAVVCDADGNVEWLAVHLDCRQVLLDDSVIGHLYRWLTGDGFRRGRRPLRQTTPGASQRTAHGRSRPARRDSHSLLLLPQWMTPAEWDRHAHARRASGK